MKILRIVIIVFIIVSCSTKENIYDIAIKESENFDFSALNNTFISYRGTGEGNNEVVLMLNKFDTKCSPYVITVNTKTKKIININSSLINERCDNKFSEAEIEKYIKVFLNLNFIVLGVDSDNNVYINPTKQQEACLVKFVKIEDNNNIKKYTKYRGNWYIKKK